ncbi:glycoside hydrolase domain-containing protein, partial [Nocardia sp. NPDC051900]|uniref:glycoside hydrolase domain-containing protein n=1 Tax=Nocardia sp. NPDC051900 TaxID=3364326 RepID=UPI0037AA8EC7
MTLGLDYAGGRPDPDAIKANGYRFVVRYLSSGGPSLPGKQLLPWEADALRAAGIEIVSNWET